MRICADKIGISILLMYNLKKCDILLNMIKVVVT